MRERMSKKLIEEILEKDGYKCQYCGEELSVLEASIDYIVPATQGGEMTVENLVTACRICNVKKADKELRRYLFDSIKSNSEYYNNFVGSIDSIKEMASANAFSDETLSAFMRMLYLNVITSLETYLSDAYINTVLSSPKYIRKVVETDKAFTEQKFDLREIYDKYDNISEIVQDHIIGVIYHNIWKAKVMYKNTLNIEFPNDIREMSKAVSIRHDLVHRNGKNHKTGKTHQFRKEDIDKTIEMALGFVNHIENDIKILNSNHIGDRIKDNM